MSVKTNPTNIAFVINPISGTSRKRKIERHIAKIFNDTCFNYSIVKTEYSGHATTLASELSKKYDIVVAVGGDGTLNEVARGLLNTKAKLGIVPCGSGNGLARHLKIPLNPQKALRAIKNGTNHVIDTVVFNGIPFLNLSGIGFDAQVAHKFSQSVRRGVLSYLYHVVRVYCHFKPIEAEISIDNVSFSRKTLLIAFANSSQFGNNAVISPISDVSDGVFEICILKPFMFFDIFVVVGRMFTKTMHKCRHLEIIQTQKATITTKIPVAAHIDGTPFVIDTNFEIKMNQKALTIIF